MKIDNTIIKTLFYWNKDLSYRNFKAGIAAIVIVCTTAFALRQIMAVIFINIKMPLIFFKFSDILYPLCNCVIIYSSFLLAYKRAITIKMPQALAFLFGIINYLMFFSINLLIFDWLKLYLEFDPNLIKTILIVFVILGILSAIFLGYRRKEEKLIWSYNDAKLDQTSYIMQLVNLMLVSAVVMLVGLFVFAFVNMQYFDIFTIMLVLFMLIKSYILQYRRLLDAGKNKWWLITNICATIIVFAALYALFRDALINLICGTNNSVMATIILVILYLFIQIYYAYQFLIILLASKDQEQINN